MNSHYVCVITQAEPSATAGPSATETRRSSPDLPPGLAEPLRPVTPPAEVSSDWVPTALPSFTNDCRMPTVTINEPLPG